MTFRSSYSYLTRQTEPNDPHPSSASIRTSLQLNSGNFGGGLGFLARDGSLKQAAIFSRQLQMQICSNSGQSSTDPFPFPVVR